MSNQKAIATIYQQRIAVLLITVGITTILNCFSIDTAIAQENKQPESQSVTNTANVNEVKSFIYN